MKNFHVWHIVRTMDSPWTTEKLQQTIHNLRARGSDTRRLEVKSAHVNYPESLDATLGSFSNLPGGGTIILGLDERNNFRPIGVYNVSQLEKAIESKLRKKLSPPNVMESHHILYGGKDILIIEIPGLAAHERPAKMGAFYYIRSGDGDYRMSDYEIRIMLSQREQHNYDREPAKDSTPEDLDADFVSHYVEQVRASSARMRNLSDEDILTRTNVLTPDRKQLTLGGVYALGVHPPQFFQTLSVNGVVVDTTGKSRNLDKLNVSGPIPYLLSETIEWVMRNLRKPVLQRSDGHLEDGEEVPGVAIREIIANALVHRSLNPNTQHYEVQVRILPWEIQVINPGGLWTITEDQLETHGYKAHVNPTLYSICQKLVLPGTTKRVIEGEGEGIPAAQEAVREAGLKPIRFTDMGARFKAVISREPNEETPKYDLVEDVQTRTPQYAAHGTVLKRESDQQVYEFIRGAEGEVNIADIYTGLHSNLSKQQIRYIITKLLNAGLIVREGGQGNRNTTYRVAQ